MNFWLDQQVEGPHVKLSQLSGVRCWLSFIFGVLVIDGVEISFQGRAALCEGRSECRSSTSQISRRRRKRRISFFFCFFFTVCQVVEELADGCCNVFLILLMGRQSSCATGFREQHMKRPSCALSVGCAEDTTVPPRAHVFLPNAMGRWRGCQPFCL